MSFIIPTITSKILLENLHTVQSERLKILTKALYLTVSLKFSPGRFGEWSARERGHDRDTCRGRPLAVQEQGQSSLALRPSPRHRPARPCFHPSQEPVASWRHAAAASDAASLWRHSLMYTRIHAYSMLIQVLVVGLAKLGSVDWGPWYQHYLVFRIIVYLTDKTKFCLTSFISPEFFFLYWNPPVLNSINANFKDKHSLSLMLINDVKTM